ncbi:sigma 54-interacting transcriptional regulator [uncultured Mailhella sp.]|uniref:sigma-54 interaction domain-containing protein n=1 Tax=uncultured Mailhella sp. TaxID=1981031 RepID=UPI002632C3DE|nr:sigma 54-interacting transcriptional regulator [uncultured Mailhella sp.]
MQDENFSFEMTAKSCLVMYRMGGLRHALLYLHDLLESKRRVVRINTLYCDKTASYIINMADTSTVSVSNKFAGAAQMRPLIMSEKTMEPIIVDDLAPYQCNVEQLDPLWRDMPYLQHASLLRLPLFVNKDNVFLINFWSDDVGEFRHADIEDFSRLLEPLAEELRINLSDMKLHGAKPHHQQTVTGMDKLRLRPGLMAVRRIVESVARTDTTVLLLGETGTGKEAVADAIQQNSARRNEPFIKINCGAIPENLIDSELFGYAKGAFTGASGTKAGYFEMADGGTLFLDEIGEMSPASQVRLLRVLDTGMICRVGSTRFFPVNVRIIAATHDDLQQKVAEGRFRRDLWYRLSVLPIHIPPLRKSLDDIPVLVQYFVRAGAHRLGLSLLPSIPEQEMRLLLQYDWPGNVRELEHTVERALVKYGLEAGNRGLHFELMPLPEKAKTPDAGLRREQGWPTLREMEDRYIREVLEHCGGKLTGTNSATSVLNIHYSTLRTRMRRLGLLQS